MGVLTRGGMREGVEQGGGGGSSYTQCTGSSLKQGCLSVPDHFQNNYVLTVFGKCRVGSNSKAVRQPAYLTMDGAHGLLDLATELLTQTAQAKPQRRCSALLCSTCT